MIPTQDIICRWLPVLIAATMLLLSSCSGTSPAAVQLDTSVPHIRISHPQDGAVIYAAALYIAGTSQGTSAPFRLQLIDMDGHLLAETTVRDRSSTWSVEMVPGPRTVPVEATLRVIPASSADAEAIDTVSLILSTLEQRPTGVIGSISFPVEAVSIDGDVVSVTGFASGTLDNLVVLQLSAADGTILDQQSIQTINPYHIDLTAWQAELSAGNYTGPAVLEVTFPASDDAQSMRQSVSIIISDAAG